jgi:hypothetical protein
MKLILALGAWALLASMPMAIISAAAGNGTFCIDDNPLGDDCEVIYTGSGLVMVEICVENTSQDIPDPDNEGATIPGPTITVKFKCKGNTPGDLSVAPGETKCSSCMLKRVTACDSVPGVDACGKYTTTYPPAI